jgi:hypothetical protein
LAAAAGAGVVSADFRHRVWIVQFINATEGLLLLESASTRGTDKAKEDAEKLKSHM